MEETIIISLGGSLVVPEEIDIDFLTKFRDIISTQKGKHFFIITGGGKVCRKYQNAAREISNPTDEELDMIGIKALNLNAELVRVLFKDNCNVNIYGAEKPGQSTDTVAVEIAQKNHAKKVINLSNIDYAYDKDPKKFSNAIKIEQITWSDFRKILPGKWEPGLNAPFDPIAAEKAEASGIEVFILNGKNISNLEHCLNGESFIGTKIK